MSIIKVTNTNNSGAGSLRQAIEEAANSPGKDIIDLSDIGGQTIDATAIDGTNSFSLIAEGNDIQFEGSGVTINGGNSGRIFAIDGAEVSFSNLNLVNGMALDGPDVVTGIGGVRTGGALFVNNNSSVTIENRTLAKIFCGMIRSYLFFNFWNLKSKNCSTFLINYICSIAQLQKLTLKASSAIN